MKITIIWTGDTSEKYLQTGISEYIKRLKHYTKLEIVELNYLKNAKSLSEAEIKNRESEQTIQKLTPSDYVVILDEGGEEMKSMKFASFVQKHSVNGTRNLVFIIGGAYGFSNELYAKAQYKMSLSQMTFSHQMIRLIFLEQLYRAYTIIKGEPYHHE